MNAYEGNRFGLLRLAGRLYALADLVNRISGAKSASAEE